MDRMEVLVADGMSEDGTRDIVRLVQEADARVHLVDNPGRIAPTGMNVAIARARGDIVVRVDGHCEIATDYVTQCVRCLVEGKAECVGGPIETVGMTFMASAIAVAMGSKFGVGGASFRTVKDREMLSDTVPFPAYTKRTLDAVGRYDEELVRNQDDEYNSRLRKLGGRVLLSPAVRSRYYARSTVRSLWRQYFQYGYWKVRVMQKHPRQVRLRQLIPGLFVLALALSIGSALFFKVGAAIAGLLIGAYAGACLVAAIATAPSAGWRYVPVLPLVFAVLHVSYGAGFIKGLVVFVRRWEYTIEAG
jgi:glycosyltransferase involved in cell wall biosynthesis